VLKEKRKALIALAVVLALPLAMQNFYARLTASDSMDRAKIRIDEIEVNQAWVEKIRVAFKDFIINISKPEFADCPKTLEGEILIDREYGWVTITPENLYRVFKEVFEGSSIPLERKLDAMITYAELNSSAHVEWLKKAKERGVQFP